MIGLYGGTFNPIHVGHLKAARAVATALELEEVVFIPNARPPHKLEGDAGGGQHEYIAPAEDRFRWVKAAIAGDDDFSVSRIEIEREGPSYLIESLQVLTGGRVGDHVFIVGQDAFCEMGTWRKPEEIFASCHIAVTTRPPILRGRLDEWLPAAVRDEFEVEEGGLVAHHVHAETRITLVEIEPIDISASELRAAIARGDDVSEWLPRNARDAIVASELYLPNQHLQENRQ